MIRTSSWAAITLALASLASISSGAVIVANTGNNNSAGGQGSTLLLAAGFVSPTVATTITSVALRLDVNNANADSGTVSLSLYSDNGGVPGSVLASLGSTSVLAADPDADYVFTPGAGVNIAASTQYWLVTTCACPSTVLNWGGTTAISSSGLPGSSVTPSAFFSSNNGATWGSATDRTLLFQVNGDVTESTVPEPSTFGLTLGAAGLLYLKRRR